MSAVKRAYVAFRELHKLEKYDNTNTIQSQTWILCIFSNNSLNKKPYTAVNISCVSCCCDEKQEGLTWIVPFVSCPRILRSLGHKGVIVVCGGFTVGRERGSDFTLCWTETRSSLYNHPTGLWNLTCTLIDSQRLNPLSYFSKSLNAGCTVWVNLHRSHHTMWCNVIYSFYVELAHCKVVLKDILIAETAIRSIYLPVVCL